MLALETQQDFLVFILQIWGDYLIRRINPSFEIVFLVLGKYILSVPVYI